MSDTQTEIQDLKQSVALLSQLLALGAERAEREKVGEPHKSASLIAHEARALKIANALKPRTEIPPEGDGSDYVTMILGRMHREDRIPDWNLSYVGIQLHDPAADEWIKFGLLCEIPCFIPARFWSGSWPRESNALNNLMRVGALKVLPGVVVTDTKIAKEYAEAVGLAWLHAGSAKSRITEDEMLRVARLVDPHVPELARSLRSLAAGVILDVEKFGMSESFGSADLNDE